MSFRPSALLLAAVSSLALAAPPAPQPTAGANGIKQLRFDWNAVTGATGYELWFKANAGAQPVRYFQMPASQRSVINNVAVHLLDWGNARYWVSACDLTGCTASSQLAVNTQMPDTIGLFSSPSQQAASQFGYVTALSDDGRTLAVAAPFEATSDPALPKGSAYIYRKSGNGWVFQSAIPFDVARQGNTRNVRLSLDGAGNVLAVALMGDKPHGAATGIGSGSVKIFRHVPGHGWRSDATIAMQTGIEWTSAEDVELNDAGNTLAVKTVLGESGVYVYTYDDAGTWSHTGTALGHGADVDEGDSCGQFSLSADGKVLAYTCGSFDPDDTVLEVHAAPDWGIRDTIDIPAGTTYLAAEALDATGDALAVTLANSSDFTDIRVEIHRRASGSYQREAVLRPGAWTRNSGNGVDGFGSQVRFSTDGKLLAISDPGDRGVGIGSLAPPLTAGSRAIGAVYIYERRSNGSWNLRRVVKPGRAGAAFEAGQFGRDIAFADNGRVLAVGHPTANNNAGVLWLY
jgi:hypothetical protein